MSKHPFIALEGLSGVGKSTIARLLAAMIDGVYLSTPPDPLPKVRELIDREYSHQARYFFYLAGVIHASAIIRQALQNQPVVCDRYILTTECFHRVVGVKTRIRPSGLGLVAPDLTVLLTAEEKTLHSRLDDRGRTVLDRVEEGEVAQALLEAYREWNLPEIDTTYMSPEEVALEVLNLTKLNRRDL